ncbi:MAG: hypothetical protein IJV14_06690 [Lachnospiraceae bacterium]|nr:hypothetical protein [Lachnospiraceae bacterium]
MKLFRMQGRADSGYAVFGSLWKQGEIPAEKAGFRLQTAEGEVPLQSRITAYWPDGSVKWAAHTADSAKMGESAEILPDLTAAGQEGPCQGSVEVKEEDGALRVFAGTTQVVFPTGGSVLFRDLVTDGRTAVTTASLVMMLEHGGAGEVEGIESQRTVERFTGQISDVKVMECGQLRCVLKITGTHVSDNTGGSRLPFTLYAEIYKDCPELSFKHTFVYDADEKNDFLKGIGIDLAVPAKGPGYNRHVQIKTDHGYFTEAGTMLLSWRPRIASSVYEAQIGGKMLTLDPEADASILKAAQDMPQWDEYILWQDSSEHFEIRKRTDKPQTCYITGLHGSHAAGTAAFYSECGGLAVGMRNFREKYPASVRMTGLCSDVAHMQLWFRAPQSEAMDFRHYTDKGYSQTYYEGFDNFGASPYGIACSSEFSILSLPDNGCAPSGEALDAFSQRVQKKAIYTASPEYYHDLHAFGRWSLPRRDTPAEEMLEDRLEKMVDFYLKEREVRKWYGMFDYGDVMHTYDKQRHVWRYDIGGYAWQNTELVPTLWLWIYYLRTGRPDVFDLAEAMTQHCEDVDIYHIGPMQGLGSRHNVRHWGCPCKEARVAMAGHHRTYYYLTGDYRTADVFDDVKDADYSTVYLDPLRTMFPDRSSMVYPTHARSGPDWSSFCSNWMTQWERYQNTEYENKIRIGIEDIKSMPLELISGTDFEYDPETSHLRYIGERASGGTHLQICQGAEQTWLEMTDLMGGDWSRMLAEYGRFYVLPHEQQLEESKGLIGEREFSFPFMAGGVSAYAADYYGDHELGRRVWDVMMKAFEEENGEDLLTRIPRENAGNQEVLDELPNVTTNVFAQWSLNVITALEFIREDLPEPDRM